MLFTKLNFFCFSINLILLLLIFEEIICLPLPSETLSLMFNYKFNAISASFFLILILLIFPMFSITFILCSFKKYVFEYNKPLQRCFYILMSILFLNYFYNLGKCIFYYYAQLGFYEMFYFIIRISPVYTTKRSHDFYYEVISNSINHCFFFVFFYGIFEFKIIYSQLPFEISVLNFLLKNKKILIYLFSIVVLFLVITMIISKNMGEMGIDNNSLLKDFFVNTYQLILVNLLGMYFYTSIPSSL